MSKDMQGNQLEVALDLLKEVREWGPGAFRSQLL